MFVLEFENPLFEFEYAKPHCDPLFAFAPTFSSSVTCAVFLSAVPERRVFHLLLCDGSANRLCVLFSSLAHLTLGVTLGD